MTEKTHYRKVFKSDHLGVADLEDFIEAGSNLTFKIKEVKQLIGVQVAGRKINANIAFFHEPIKPLVLNAGNSKIMKALSGGSAFVEDWTEIVVQLYIEPTAKLKGEVVGGVRINPNSPKSIKPTLTPTSDRWDEVVEAYRRDKSMVSILSRVDISEQHQALIKELANVS